jgi:hypothetical protein
LIGDRVVPRAGVDDMEKRKCLNLPGLELRPLGRPARKMKENGNERREGRIKEEGRKKKNERTK